MGAPMRRAACMIFASRFLPAWIILSVLAFFIPDPAVSSTYFYKKEINGVVHYTNIDPKSSEFKRIVSPWGTFRGTPKNKRGYLNNYKYSDKFDEHITTTARWYGVDPLLVKAMVKVESNFNPEAISPAGAMGVMQLMPGTAERVGVKDPFDPIENIEGGVKYLSMLMEMFGNDTTLAIAGYNAGENAVIKYGYQIPPYEETIEYVDRVYAHYDRLKNGAPVDRNIKTRMADRKDGKKPAIKAKKSSKSFIYVETLGGEKVYKNRNVPAAPDSKPANTTGAEASARGRTLPSQGPKGEVQSVVSDSEGRYTVQVASFPDRQLAEEMEREFKAKNYPAYTEEVEIPGKGTWYRVKIGKFSTETEASKYGDDIKSAEPGVKSILITMN